MQFTINVSLQIEARQYYYKKSFAQVTKFTPLTVLGQLVDTGANGKLRLLVIEAVLLDHLMYKLLLLFLVIKELNDCK